MIAPGSGTAAKIALDAPYDVLAGGEAPMTPSRTVSLEASAPAGTIDRVSGITPREFMREYALRQRPVVLVDAARGWPALDWDAAFFRRRYGHLQVRVEGEPISLAELMDEFESGMGPGGGKPRYLRLLKFEDHLPDLIPEFRPLPGYGPDRLRNPLILHNAWFRNGSPELLLAGRGAHFPVLHYDNESAHAFVTQIRGDKQFFLYTPDQTPLMYPKPDNRHESRIDGFDPVEQARFPLFAQARPMTTVLRPGETIFIPARHWHMTRVNDLSIALTFNSVGRSNWKDFAYDRAHWRPGFVDEKSLANTLKYAYLRLLGVWMTAAERIARGY